MQGTKHFCVAHVCLRCLQGQNMKAIITTEIDVGNVRAVTRLFEPLCCERKCNHGVLSMFIRALSIPENRISQH